MTQEQALTLMKTGKNVFLTGAAGSGKTYVLNQYTEYLDENFIPAAITASTGIAATHIGGVTIHSWSGVGIRDTLSEYDLEQMEEKQYLYKRFQKTNVLIIDEISMISDQLFTMIDRICRHMKRDSRPFGGMQIIVSGDFFQLPPIAPRREESQELFGDVDEEKKTNHFAFSSPSWEDADIHVCYLSTQYRQKDSEILNILNQLRSGEVPKESREQLESRIVDAQDPEITRLYTHNINVDTFNNQRLEVIGAEHKTYTMTGHGKPPLIDALKRGCLAPEVLTLKIGAKVMFVKNNPVQGYVNGTVGTVVEFKDNVPVVETAAGKRFVAHVQSWMIDDNGKSLAEIAQIPLRLAWAITVHKSQGMTLSEACIDLSKAFEMGQGYVALSRIEDFNGLYLIGFNEQSLCVHPDIIEKDAEFKEESSYVLDDLEKIKEKDLEEDILNFVEVNQDAKKKKQGKSSGPKKTTFEQTCDLVKMKMSIPEMAEERSLTEGTIMEHIERLLEESLLSSTDVEYLKPKDADFKEAFDVISNAFKKTDGFALSPVFNECKKKYSYDQIRFARLFIKR